MGKVFCILSGTVYGLVLLACLPAAAQDNVNVGGFFDKNEINQSMVGDGFAERRHTEPKQPVAGKRDSFAAEHYARRIQRSTSSPNEEERPNRRGQDLVTPDLSATPWPMPAPRSEFAVPEAAPPQPAPAKPVEEEDGAARAADMAAKLKALQDPGSFSKSGEYYYDKILQTLEQRPSKGPLKDPRKENQSVRF